METTFTMNMDSLLMMLIASFALALILIMKKESIPDRARRPLAIFTLFMVVSSIVFLIITIYRLGME